jgi:16S rRNA (guanine527-N7)-methyltransferase
MNGQSVDALLDQGVSLLDFDVPVTVRQRLINWLTLLMKWNAAFNLTAIRQPHEMVIKHLLDSLVIHPWIEADDILDVGTGAGLPGIPLALLNPQRRFTLLDSNGKKTRFIAQSKLALGLENVEVVHGRIEDHAKLRQHELIVSRAFSSLHDFVRLTLPALKPGGRLLAMKGQVPDAELSAPEVAVMRPAVIPLQVPLLPDARHLVILQP